MSVGAKRMSCFLSWKHSLSWQNKHTLRSIEFCPALQFLFYYRRVQRQASAIHKLAWLHTRQIIVIVTLDTPRYPQFYRDHRARKFRR